MKHFTPFLFIVIALICAIYVIVSIYEFKLFNAFIGVIGLAISLYATDYTLQKNEDELDRKQ